MHRGSVSGFAPFPYDFHCFQLEKHPLVFFRGLSLHGVDVLPFASYYMGECPCGLGELRVSSPQIKNLYLATFKQTTISTPTSRTAAPTTLQGQACDPKQAHCGNRAV